MRILVLLALAFFVSSCGYPLSYYQKIIEENLELGSPPEAVVEFLESTGWIYGYDDFASRFSAYDPNERFSFFCATAILIKMENDQFIEIETYKTCTFF